MRRTSPDVVVRLVCAACFIKSSELLSERRFRNIVEARNIATYLLREDGGYTFAEIGAVLGKHHSTVIHSYQQAKLDLANADSSLRSTIEEIRKTAAAAKEKRQSAAKEFKERAISPQQSVVAAATTHLRIPTATLIVEVAREFRVDPEDIRGPKQKAHLVRTRDVAVFLMREDLRKTYPQIGRFLHRHHTTVIASHTRALVKQNEDANFIAALESIRARCRELMSASSAA